MVLIVDGDSENVPHADMKIDLFGEKILFVTALDHINCL